MNLTKLFDTQRILDERIVRQKGLEGRDLLPNKILALLVELGELANEERSWKFWSNNQTARNQDIECHACKGLGEFHSQTFSGVYHVDDKAEICLYCEGTGIQEKNPLIMEYVDCLHFILSIGLAIRMEDVKPFSFKYENITAQFIELFADTARSYEAIGIWTVDDTENNYLDIFCGFIGLGEMLGFTWEQIETAYFEKNAINHKRQDNGY